LRHSFAGNVFDVSSDFKITADMLGHSTSQCVTARYTKTTRAEKLRDVYDKMQNEGVDLDRLEARAKELFFGGKNQG
jgi:site-specific recombinase XerD